MATTTAPHTGVWSAVLAGTRCSVVPRRWPGAFDRAAGGATRYPTRAPGGHLPVAGAIHGSAQTAPARTRLPKATQLYQFPPGSRTENSRGIQKNQASAGACHVSRGPPYPPTRKMAARRLMQNLRKRARGKTRRRGFGFLCGFFRVNFPRRPRSTDFCNSLLGFHPGCATLGSQASQKTVRSRPAAKNSALA